MKHVGISLLILLAGIVSLAQSGKPSKPYFSEEQPLAKVRLTQKLNYAINGARFARDHMLDPESFRVSRVWFIDFRVCMEFRSKNSMGGYVQGAGVYDDYDVEVFYLHAPDDKTSDLPFHDTCAMSDTQNIALDASNAAYKGAFERQRNAYETTQRIINETYEKEVKVAKTAVAEGQETHVQGFNDEDAAENKRYMLTKQAIAAMPRDTGDKPVDVTDQVKAVLKADRDKE